MRADTDSSRKRTKAVAEADDDFPMTLTKSGVQSKIYRHKDDKGYEVFTLVYHVRGQRKRPTFASLKAAREEAERVLDLLAKGEPEELTLTSTERLAYLRAREVLDKLSVPVDVAASHFAHATALLNGQATLTDAVTWYLKMRPKAVKSPTVRKAVDELLKARKADGSSPRHIHDLECRLNRFARAFQCAISAVTPSDIHDFLTSLKLEPRTVNNHRTAISNLFTFARLKNFVAKDYRPLEEVPEFKEPIKPVPILTPQQMRALLENVSDEFLPYLAIAAFGGLRQSEIERLEWTHVGPKYIKVPPASHRVKSTRLVPIQPNLSRWLAICRKLEGKVLPFKNPTNQLVSLCQKAGIKQKHNMLRHSFGSYRLAIVEDASKVAFEMGNSPQMVFRNYREVVTPEEGHAWFGITPDSTRNLVAFTPPQDLPNPADAEGASCTMK
jgi:integrase